MVLLQPEASTLWKLAAGTQTMDQTQSVFLRIVSSLLITASSNSICSNNQLSNFQEGLPRKSSAEL